MLKGPMALVAATGASGLFSFGFIQSAFAPQAQALFIVFAAVLLLLMLANRLSGGDHGAHSHAAHRHGAHGGGEHAVVMSRRTAGTIMMVAGVLAVAHFWTDNDLSGEKIGRFIDRGAVSLSQQAQVTLVRLTDGISGGSAAGEQQAPPEEG